MRVRRFPPLQDDELQKLFVALVMDQGKRTPRAVGEPVEAGDEVTVDAIAYSNRRIVPFSPREDLQLLLSDETLKDPMAAGLVGVPVGSKGTIRTILPADYRAISHRGKPAVYGATIKASSAVEEPDMDDPALYVALGLGKTLEESMDAFVRQIETYRQSALDDLAMLAVFDELYKRTPFTIPKILVEKQLLKHWTDAEGKFLRRVGISPVDYDDAFEGWLANKELFSEVERNMRNIYLLQAVSDAYALKFDRRKLEDAAVKNVTEVVGGKPSALRESWNSEAAAKLDTLFATAMMQISDFVRSKVKIEYV